MRKTFCSCFLFLGTLSLLITGCATIMTGGGAQSINVESNPSEAEVTIIDLYNNETVTTGNTPVAVTLKKSQGYFKKGRYKMIIEKDGYSPEEILIEGTANGWYVAGNILVGGLIGWLIVDPASGAMYTLSPKGVSTDLKDNSILKQDVDGLTVVVDANLKSIPDPYQMNLREVVR